MYSEVDIKATLFPFLFLCSITVATAADESVQGIISEKYTEGAYLIYDCQEKHWVCVTKDIFEDCEKKRNSKEKGEIDLYHKCAPFEALPTKQSCVQRQLFLTSQNHGQRFCIKDKWKSKAVTY